jgi:hypothetical protein
MTASKAHLGTKGYGIEMKLASLDGMPGTGMKDGGLAAVKA